MGALVRTSLLALQIASVAACQHGAAPPRRAPDPICDQAVELRIEHRVEGPFVLFEREERPVCNPPPAAPRKLVAKIELPASPTACPLGQAALRVWGGREKATLLPQLVAALDSATLDATWKGLWQFAEGRPAEAFVTACGSTPDWLFVGDGRVALFASNELKPHRDEQGVLVVSLPKPLAAPPAPPQPTGDCSERLDQGDTRLVGRELSDGPVGPSTLRTYTLMRSGDHATMVVQEKAKGPRAPAAGWQCRQSKTLSGTIVQRGAQLVLRLAEASRPSEVREVTCTPKGVSAARAEARRVAVPAGREDCNAYRWEPAALTARTVLSCTSPSWAEWPSEVFLSAAPGIERLTVFEDCDEMTKPPLRAVRADGGVLPGAAPWGHSSTAAPARSAQTAPK